MEYIVETPRLYLRNFISDDFEALAKMFRNEDVMRYIGTGIVLTEEHARKSIENWPKYEQKHGFTNWAVVRKVDNIMIGKCGFNWLPGNSDIEIAYMFDKPYWGKGYATEIGKATLDYGFNHLKFKRIAALVYPENKVSVKVIEKMGMVFEKAVSYWNVNLNLYSALNPETL